MRKLALILVLPLVFSVAHAVTFTDFYAVFVDIPGWEAESPTGQETIMPMGKVVFAERHYSKGDKSFTARVVVGPVAMTFSNVFMSTIEYRNDEGMLKNASVKGFKAKIVYNFKERAGYVAVLLTKAVAPYVMVFEFENMDYNEALSLANKFPVGRAARLVRNFM